MNWQVRYALANIAKTAGRTKAEFVTGNLIRLSTEDQPDVLALISSDELIDEAVAKQYVNEFPDLDFICGYRTTCVWVGGAIEYLEARRVGWGNFGTLLSAALEGNANTASHKMYRFSSRILRQHRSVERTERKFDRIHRVFLKDGRTVTIGMVSEYEPTADAIRSLWEQFGPLDFVWNINPNGRPSFDALDAGRELGCEVLKWEELRERLSNA
ncbi:hypothetical protein [Falsiroseomonas sp.]|uniref:hypothetical protein n=1 Tax=Falsiroseomonas sp. TaxID=2870721 RepID=UPI003F6FC08C